MTEQPVDVTGPNLSAPGAILRDAGDVESVALGPNRVAFLLGGGDTGGAYSLTAWTMAPPPAPGPPPHIHLDADEAIYVVEGVLECRIGDEVITAHAGGVVLVPRGMRHTVANAGPDPSRFLVVLQPPGFEGYWREMARLTAANGQPDPERVLALQETYHMHSEAARRFE